MEMYRDDLLSVQSKGINKGAESIRLQPLHQQAIMKVSSNE